MALTVSCFRMGIVMYQDKIQQILDQVNLVIKGKENVVEKALMAMIAGGHILMEDIPGVGKTTLSTTFAKTMSLNYHRVQFTPDVLPSDLLGFSMYNSQSQSFEFHQGAVFCNLLLADEINRTSPKTQSALLEVMEEGQVSVEGQSYLLEEPFIVIATQNPSGSAGTQLLPESQMDRFMVCLSMGYPQHQDAVSMLKEQVWDKAGMLSPILTAEELLELRKGAEKVFVHDSVYEYIVSLTEATRQNELFRMGASPRASIAMLKMARAAAFMKGQDYVTAENVQNITADVLGHRAGISQRAVVEGLNRSKCFERLFHSVPSPKL